MIFEKDGNITLVIQEKCSIPELVKKLEATYPKFKNDNVIINLLVSKDVALSNMKEFLEISTRHREANHSFVIVSNQIDLDEIPDEIVVVPTVKEAYDVIEMEDMERDLGF